MLFSPFEGKKMNEIIIISKLKPSTLSLVNQLAERRCISEAILLSEAVYMLTIQGKHLDEIKKAVKFGVTFFVLSEDIEKRGIIKLLHGVTVIDYINLVDMLLEKPKRIINL